MDSKDRWAVAERFAGSHDPQCSAFYDYPCGCSRRVRVEAIVQVLADVEREASEGCPGCPKETAWLIESRFTPNPSWWMGTNHPAPWTRDSLQAVRFARKQDAEAARVSLPEVHVAFVSEHQWGLGQECRCRAAGKAEGRREERERVLPFVHDVAKMFDQIFGHCLSNGVFNAWGKSLNCSLLNKVGIDARSLLQDHEAPSA